MRIRNPKFDAISELWTSIEISFLLIILFLKKSHILFFLQAVLRIPKPRILIFTHPGSRISDLLSRIPDQKTATKERGGKKFVVISFYVATKFTKLKIILVLKS